MHSRNAEQAAPRSRSRPEIWAGFECTIARIGDTYRNQLADTGHADRPEDLDAVAALGIRTLRFPVLWEMVAPTKPAATDWSWPDARLARLRALGIEPIAGLLHHGSGPRYTSLVDPAFPELLAGFAARVAERYPWITSFTPVNEPLTTARFSGLYGHWYPHGRDEATFLRALHNQCKGVALAMRAIRRVTPGARLVQTEDLGRVFSTARLAYQAEYENIRRWLSFDLLTGRVGTSHPFFARFLAAGVAEHELRALVDEPCPPDVVGINHYLTSDRYLDHETDGYPADALGGNAVDTYADIAAARAHVPLDQLGPAARLREAWDRYGLPVASTEVHNGSTREEQLRWLLDAWHGVRELCAQGVDVRAFTLWAAAGAVDWNSLLTRQAAFYEPGLFDARSSPPRPTAIAVAASKLAAEGSWEHPVLASPGWWRRPDRFHKDARRKRAGTMAAKPILVTGRTGTLGRAFGRMCDARGLEHVLLGRAEMDIAERRSVLDALARVRPWAIVNTAGYVRVADAHREPVRCMRENADGPAILAEAARELGIPLVTFSSDLVFDGRTVRPYVEADPTCPLCVYGESKVTAEKAVMGRHDGALIVRTAAFFGPWDQYNFAHAVLKALRAGESFAADSSTVVSPTYVPDLIDASLDLLIDGASGIWHVANEGGVSWHEFARKVAIGASLDPARVTALPEAPPRRTALASGRGVRLPPLEEALERFQRAAA